MRLVKPSYLDHQPEHIQKLQQMEIVKNCLIPKDH
jgi:hypothetical protein